MTGTTNPHLHKSFDQPDEQETFPNGTLDLIALGDDNFIGRIKFESGWRYTDQQTPDTTVPHFGVIAKGSMKVSDSDGREHQINEGGLLNLAEVTDAWTEGPCEMYDYINPRQFAGAATT